MSIKDDFPILNQKVNQKQLVYVDNAATTQKPQIVIDSINDYYKKINSNVHRGIHTLSEKATDEFEKTRDLVAKFINAKRDQIAFTKGTTDSINKIAFGLKHLLKKGDEIVISQMEHHANIVPWQELARQTNSKLKIIPFNDDFELDYKEAQKLITKKTKIVSITHISNVLGTINDIEKIIKIAKNVGAITVIDGAQGIVHKKIDVKKLDCNYYVFSAHKLYGPTGVGVIYGKDLNELKPTEFGGAMIETVDLYSSTYAKAPEHLEAGTPNIEGVVAFGKSINYIEKIGYKKIEKIEDELTSYFLEKIKTLGDDFKLLGTKDEKKRVGVFSFIYKNIHSADLSEFLDQYGIAIRGGHHCAQLLHNFLDISESSRISFAIYNTKEEIDKIIDSLEKIGKLF